MGTPACPARRRRRVGQYNHSYPASLKAAIDWHFAQWTAKPVAFVSYGGAAGGRHAVLHLENVLTELTGSPPIPMPPVMPRRCWTNSPGGPPLSAQRAPKGLTHKADSEGPACTARPGVIAALRVALAGGRAYGAGYLQSFLLIHLPEFMGLISGVL